MPSGRVAAETKEYSRGHHDLRLDTMTTRNTDPSTNDDPAESVPTQLAIRSRCSYDATALRELIAAAQPDSLSPAATQLREAVLSETTATIDEGVSHGSWEWNEPCAECGSTELFIYTVVDDRYVVTDGCADPVDHGTVWGNPIVRCVDCDTTLYRQPGI